MVLTAETVLIRKTLALVVETLKMTNSWVFLTPQNFAFRLKEITFFFLMQVASAKVYGLGVIAF